MPLERFDAACLHDMLKSAEAVGRYLTGKSRQDYEQDEMLRDAVERRIEIIGEAARRLSREFQEGHPGIPWRKIMATRHVVAHDYDEINNDIIWRIATAYVPDLLEQLKPLIPPEPFVVVTPPPAPPEETGT
jgi:uncharacterized protein with HEPN domain